MGFATTAETNYEGTSYPVLQPDIYDNATFLGAKYEKDAKKDNGEALDDRINFNFKTESGQPFTHSEIKPDTDEKETNMVKRVGHILSKFYPKEQLVQGNTTFDSYANWAVGMANNAVSKGQKVKFAVVGSVYTNGQGVLTARTGFPRYLPFMVKAGEDLSFDNNALTSNAEYAAFKKPPTPDAAGAKPDSKTVGEF